MTIPKAIREKLGLRVGDVVEVAADKTGRMVARKVTFERPGSLDWRGEFAKRHKITEADIVRISRTVRREVFRKEYD